jgi:hypothetical protein
MQFPKVFKDAEGDTATVAPCGLPDVHLTVREGELETLVCLTPAQARRLAKALKKAAKVAEGNG